MKIRKQKKNQVNENLSTINVKDRKELSKLLERLNKMKIKSTIKRCLDENFRFTVTSRLNENYRGVPEIEFVWHGEWSDPELIYKDETFNYWDVEDALWQDYLDENGDENDEDAFDKYVREHAVNMLDDWLSVREESLKESVEKDEEVYRGYRIFKCKSNGKFLIMNGKNYYGPDAAGFDSIKEAKKWLDKNRKEKGTVTESCHKELKENKDKSFSNSKYKKVISEYFNYTGDFDFLDIVATIIDRIDNFEDEEDIQASIEDVMIWYVNRWEIMMFYQNPEDANFFDAYDALVSDIFGICNKIVKEGKEDKEDEEIEFEEVVEENCEKCNESLNEGVVIYPSDSEVQTLCKKIANQLGEIGEKEEVDIYYDILHDVNNLRGAEWLEVIEPVVDAELVNEFKKLIKHIEVESLKEESVKTEPINEEFKLIADLGDYKPWSGAKETWERIEEENKIDDLESLLDELYPEGLTMTELNDILWFESDWIYEMLDIKEESEEDGNEEVEESCKSEKLKESKKITWKTIVENDNYVGKSFTVLEDVPYCNIEEEGMFEDDEELLDEFKENGFIEKDGWLIIPKGSVLTFRVSQSVDSYDLNDLSFDIGEYSDEMLNAPIEFISDIEESCEDKECETIKIKPNSKKVEVEIPDNSKVGEEGHPIKQGLKDGINKLEGLKESSSIKYVYEVHSDEDENNVYNEFDEEEKAIKYAKDCNAKCFVDKVSYDKDGNFLDSETVWAYSMEENLEESTKVFEEQGTDEEIKQRYLKSLKEMYDFEPADLSEQELQDLRDAGLIK